MCSTLVERLWTAANVNKWHNWLLLVYWGFASQISAYHHLLYWAVYYICKGARTQNNVTSLKANQRGRCEPIKPGHSYGTIVPSVKTPQAIYSEKTDFFSGECNMLVCMCSSLELVSTPWSKGQEDNLSPQRTTAASCCCCLHGIVCFVESR